MVTAFAILAMFVESLFINFGDNYSAAMYQRLKYFTNTVLQIQIQDIAVQNTMQCGECDKGKGQKWFWTGGSPS